MSQFDLLELGQVLLTAQAKVLSTFVSPDILSLYKVMPFAVRKAPATIQCLVNGVLPGREAYLDDAVLCSSTWSEHLVQIIELFERLEKAN